jgi:hypothetical protein
MANCQRCGCWMKDDTAHQRLQRGRDLWGCSQCQAGQQTKVRTKFGVCQPHIGELDEHDRPLDKKGNLYRPGTRLCGYADCVDWFHIESTPLPEPVISIVPDGHKRCTRCATVKPFAGFGVDRKKRDGLNCECKTCRVNRSRKVMA